MAKRVVWLGRLSVMGLLLLLLGCTSRYRLDLYLIRGENRKKVKVESTQFIREAVLGNPYSRDKVVNGKGNCVVLTTGTRGERVGGEASDFISWDRYLRYDIYLQLPLDRPSGSIPLKNNAFLSLLGQFARPADETVYIATGGQLIVDSVTDKRLFATIDGQFANAVGEPVSFKGQFKVKHSY
jgi:hypothetical protein